MLSMMCLPGYAKVENNGDVINMSVEDANDLYRYIDELERKLQIMEERLQAEREAVDRYIASAKEERQAWQNLEDSMNAELKLCKRERYKWGIGGLLAGGLLIAIID